MNYFNINYNKKATNKLYSMLHFSRMLLEIF